jgi:cytochrome c biogenesis protein CcdA/thiol-disulfide isomerase/thioredoxin
MVLRVLIGFLAGLITSVSPCVLPVLPIVLAGSATGSRRRPWAIAAGLVASFSAFTLAGAALLDALDLPNDLLRDVAIGLLFLVAATLFWPWFGRIVERPFARLSRRPAGDLGGGFLLGASLGLVFVPCAGPILAALAFSSATGRVGVETAAIMVAYSVGAVIPMVLLASGGQRAAERGRLIRGHALAVRRTLGAVVALAALAIALDAPRHLQTLVPTWLDAFQRNVERNAASDYLEQVSGRGPGGASAAVVREPLDDSGPAPEFQGIVQWLNTPGGRPLSLRSLRGKVVLVDFWTYSCINCLRTLPHVTGWYDRYRGAGLVVVGVHSPEFAFERVPGNVRDAVARLDVDYPVALDNGFRTWEAYDNQYWPAKYLIDRNGHLRYAHFGEGAYDETERLIRRLLAVRGTRLPGRLGMPDRTPTQERTPEIYLGFRRAANYATSISPNTLVRYSLPTDLPADGVGLGGLWRIGGERIVAGQGARLRLHFRARQVHVVLSGTGRVTVRTDGRRVRRFRVRENRLYTVLARPASSDGVVDLAFTPGVAAYAFTFG